MSARKEWRSPCAARVGRKRRSSRMLLQIEKNGPASVEPSFLVNGSANEGCLSTLCIVTVPSNNAVKLTVQSTSAEVLAAYQAYTLL